MKCLSTSFFLSFLLSLPLSLSLSFFLGYLLHVWMQCDQSGLDETLCFNSKPCPPQSHPRSPPSNTYPPYSATSLLHSPLSLTSSPVYSVQSLGCQENKTQNNSGCSLVMCGVLLFLFSLCYCFWLVGWLVCFSHMICRSG